MFVLWNIQILEIAPILPRFNPMFINDEQSARSFNLVCLVGSKVSILGIKINICINFDMHFFNNLFQEGGEAAGTNAKPAEEEVLIETSAAGTSKGNCKYKGKIYFSSLRRKYCITHFQPTPIQIYGEDRLK